MKLFIVISYKQKNYEEDNNPLFHQLSKFFELEIIDLSSTFPARLKRINFKKFDIRSDKFKLHKIKSLKEFHTLMKGHPNSLVIKNYSDEIYDWPISIILQIVDIKIINIFDIAYIGNVNTVTGNKVFEFFRKLLNKPVYVKKVIEHRIFLLLHTLGVFKKIDTMFLSSKDLLSTYVKKNLIKDFCFISSLSSQDNKIIRDTEIANKHIVYLGQNFIYQDYDLKREGEEPINYMAYGQELKRLFDHMEKFYNKKIVVCAHPKYDEKNSLRDFGRREVVKNRTLEMIVKADFVIGHFSSAINYSLYLSKPVFLITSSLFSKNSWVSNSIQRYSTILNVQATNISEEKNLNKENIDLALREGMKSKYLNKYITDNISIYHPYKVDSTNIIVEYLRAKYL